MKDARIIVAGRNRREAANPFAELYEAHAPAAMRLALVLTGERSAAEDLVQDAFVRLIGAFRDRRQPDSFDRYLRTTIINLARTRWRRLGRREKLDATDVTVADHAPGVALGETLWRQIIQLPPRQRAALFLRYYEDRSLQDIAACLSCSVGAAKSLLRHALQKLRQHDQEVKQ